MTFDRRIVVDGNDGTGKSTLVHSLRCLGFTNVDDRGEMSKATLDPSVGPAPDTTYILLVSDWQVSKQRLIEAGRDMTEKWHTDEALRHYDAEFRRLAPSFGAIVIETRHPDQTLVDAVKALNTTVRIGIASGRLLDKGVQQFEYPLSVAELPGRRLYGNFGPFTLIQTRSKTYPQMVALGALDVAVVGSDALEGNPYAAQVVVVDHVAQRSRDGHPVRMVLAGRSLVVPRSGLLQVVTPFPEWAQKVLGEKGIPHTVFPVSGGSEALVAARVADVLFDVVETGKTLEDNGLSIIEEFGTLDICIIRRRA